MLDKEIYGLMWRTLGFMFKWLFRGSVAGASRLKKRKPTKPKHQKGIGKMIFYIVFSLFVYSSFTFTILFAVNPLPDEVLWQLAFFSIIFWIE